MFRLDQKTLWGLLTLTIVTRGPQALWCRDRLKRNAQVVVQGILIPWYGATIAMLAGAITYQREGEG